MAHVIIDPTTCNDANPRFTVGGLYFHEGNWYRYVQFKDAVAFSDGSPCSWSAGDSGQAVTTDVSEDNGCAAGVARCAVTENYYGFIQVSGTVYVNTNGDDDIADGAVIVISADGACDSGTDPGLVTALGIAVAADIDATNKVLTLLKGLM